MSAPHLCCGRAPTPRHRQVAEDAVDSWFECKVCGRQSEHVEDAYSDMATAQSVWNAGRYERALATNPDPKP